MKQIITIVITLLILTFLTSCEGFKVLTIQNMSDSDARIILRPGLDNSVSKQLHTYPKNQNPDSSLVLLKPDSSITIMSGFTVLLFNKKIKEHELRIDYLQIESKNDTITAKSRQEIIDLIYSRRKGTIKSKGTNLANILIEE